MTKRLSGSRKIIVGLLLVLVSIIISVIIQTRNKTKIQPQKNPPPVSSSTPYRKEHVVQAHRGNSQAYHQSANLSNPVNSSVSTQDKARKNRYKELRRKVNQKIDRILRIIDEIED
jgi:uncharacterized protein YxeA